MTEKRKRGRPPKPHLRPEEMDLLTIPDVLRYVRESRKRGIDRKKLVAAIVAGLLPAYEDDLHHDPLGRPLVQVYRNDLDTWLASTLRPLRVSPFPMQKKRFA